MPSVINYREETEDDGVCVTCAFYNDDRTCLLTEESVNPLATCDEWEVMDGYDETEDSKDKSDHAEPIEVEGKLMSDNEFDRISEITEEDVLAAIGPVLENSDEP